MPPRWVDAACWWPPPRRSTARTPPARWSRIPTASWAHRSCALELLRGQGGRRDPGARLLEGTRHRGHRRPVLQLRRSPADRGLRHGRSRPWFARRSGARTSRSTARASSDAASATCRTRSRRWSRCWTTPTAPATPSTSAALNEVTINELAARIIERTRRDAKVRHIPYEVAYEEGFEDMERRVPDTTKINTLTGWKPTRTLDDILDDVIAFERERAVGRLTGTALRPVLNSAEAGCGRRSSPRGSDGGASASPGADGPATDSMPPRACTMSATASARRCPAPSS